MRNAIPLLCLLLASCFGSVTSPVQCGPEGQCAPGRQCISGWCVAQGEIGDGGSLGTSDAAADAAVTSPGCAAGSGVALGPRAVACAGTFEYGGASALCAAGSSPCQDSASVDLAACNSLTGFFVADVPGAWTNNFMAPLCRRTDSMISLSERPMFFGCGRLGAYSFNAQNPCKGFDRSLECATVNSKWNCNNNRDPQYLVNAKNTEAKDGILCCR